MQSCLIDIYDIKHRVQTTNRVRGFDVSTIARYKREEQCPNQCNKCTRNTANKKERDAEGSQQSAYAQVLMEGVIEETNKERESGDTSNTTNK